MPRAPKTAKPVSPEKDSMKKVNAVIRAIKTCGDSKELRKTLALVERIGKMVNK